LQSWRLLAASNPLKPLNRKPWSGSRAEGPRRRRRPEGGGGAAPGRVVALRSRPKCPGTGLQVPCRPRSEAGAPGPPKTAQPPSFSKSGARRAQCSQCSQCAPGATFGKCCLGSGFRPSDGPEALHTYGTAWPAGRGTDSDCRSDSQNSLSRVQTGPLSFFCFCLNLTASWILGRGVQPSNRLRGRCACRSNGNELNRMREVHDCRLKISYALPHYQELRWSRAGGEEEGWEETSAAAGRGGQQCRENLKERLLTHGTRQLCPTWRKAPSHPHSALPPFPALTRLPHAHADTAAHAARCKKASGAAQARAAIAWAGGLLA